MNKGLVLASAAIAAIAWSAPASAVLVTGVDPGASAGNVNVWDSGTPTDLVNGFFPIGGAGQVNGAFIISEEPSRVPGADFPVQIGIRAQARTLGPIWPRTGNIFTVEHGLQQVGPDRAFWNYDIHIDLGTNGAQGPGPLNSNFLVRLEVDSDPTAAITWNVIDINAAFGTTPWRFFQASWNPLFAVVGIPGFDEDVLGTYDFRLTVADLQDVVVAQTYMQVNVVEAVPEPVSLALFGAGLAGLGLARRRRS